MQMHAKLFAALLIAIAATAGAATIDCDDEQIVGVWASHGTIFAGRFGFDGRPLDDGPFVVADVIDHQQRSPAIAFDGRKHLIAWIHNGDVLGRFMTPDGHLESNTIRFTGGADADRVTIVWLGKEFLVAWIGPHASATTVSSVGSLSVLPLFGGNAISGEIAFAPPDDGESVVAYSGSELTIRTFRLRHHDTTAQAQLHASDHADIRIVRAPWGYLMGWLESEKVAVVLRLNESGAPIGRPLRSSPMDLRRAHPSFALGNAGDQPLVVFGTEGWLNAAVLGEPDFDQPLLVPKTVTAEKERGCGEELTLLPLKNGAIAFTCGSPRNGIRFLTVPTP